MNYQIFIFAIIILLFDIPFITYVMKPMYQKIGLANDTKIIFALCAYILMILSWYLINGDIFKAALSGLIIYGIYAFTIAAILPSYTLSMALTEIFWGTALFTFATYITNKLKVLRLFK